MKILVCKKFDLSIPRMGYFILYRNDGSFTSERIARVQRKAGFSIEDAQYTHVDVSLGGQHAVRVFAFERTSIVDIRKQYKGRYIKIVRYQNEDYEKKGRYKVAAWAASNCNLKYDYLGVFAFLTRLIKHRLSKFFCSENACWALQKEYPEALNAMLSEKCMPAHLSQELESVWEGVVN